MGDGKTHASLTLNKQSGSSAKDATSRIRELSFMGYYPKGSNGDIVRVNGYEDFDTTLGDGELRRVIEDFYKTTKNKQRAVTVLYCAASGTGSNEAVTRDPSVGAGSMTVAGTAKWFVKPYVLVTATGALGAAKIKVSLDGGYTFGAEQTVPADGQVTLATDLGLTVTFTDALAADDVYQFEVTQDVIEIGDASTAGSVHKALVDYFLTAPAKWPMRIHIVGPMTAAAINTLNTLAEDRWDNRAPCRISCEYDRIDVSTSQTVAEYATALEAHMVDASVLGKEWVSIVAGYPEMVDYDDNRINYSPAGLLLGVWSRMNKLSDSTGATWNNGADNRADENVTVYGLQFTDTQIATLDELGCCLLRRFVGKTGYYATREGTCKGAGEIEQVGDRLDVMIYAHDVVFNYLFPLIEADKDGADATNMAPKVLSGLLTGELIQKLGALVADAAAEVVETDDDTLIINIQLQYRLKATTITANLSLVKTITIDRTALAA